MIINPQATKIKKTKSVPPPTSRMNFHLQSETHLPASLCQPNCALWIAQGTAIDATKNVASSDHVLIISIYDNSYLTIIFLPLWM